MINASSIIYKINYFLLAFIPITLISGPFIPDLFCSISGILFIFLCLKYKITSHIKSKFFIYFIFFNLIIIFSSFNSNNIFYSLESSLFYFRFGILAINYWFVIENSGKKFLKILTITTTSAIILAVFSGFIQYFLNIDFNGGNISLDKFEALRISGIFGEELILGSFVSRLLPTSLALIILIYFKNTINFYIYLLGFIILSILIIFISGERAAIFNIILLLALSFFLIKIKLKLKIGFIFIVVSLFLLILNADERIYNRLIVTISHDLTEVKISKSVSWYFVSQEHQNAFFTSLNMFNQNKILGIGPKMYRKECNYPTYVKNLNYSNSCLMHPHNHYLQLMSETGILGLLFIISVFIFISYKSFLLILNKDKRDRILNYEIFLIITIFIFLWPLNHNGNFFNNYINIIHYYPLGLLLAKKNLRTIF